jgi:hypothetical protein
MSWVQTSYLIGDIIVIPLSTWLSRAISTRWLVTIGAAGFTITSMLCGMAWDLRSMIVFRVLQGQSRRHSGPSSPRRSYCRRSIPGAQAVNPTRCQPPQRSEHSIGSLPNIALIVVIPTRTKRNHEVGFRLVGGHLLKDGRKLGSVHLTAMGATGQPPRLPGEIAHRRDYRAIRRRSTADLGLR